MKQRRARALTGKDYSIELLSRFGNRASLVSLADLDRPRKRADMGDGVDVARKPYQVAEGVALIDICGVLTNDAWYCDETEYADIRSEVQCALDDASVKAILLRVCSPGGETDNAFETAAFLAEAGKQKPIWGIADNYAYSAGYLLLSQAAQIYVPPTTGSVGSIGVYCMHLDYSGMLDQLGIKATFISAGKGKMDGNPYEPLSAAAEAAYQAEVDRLYDAFTGAVSRGRQMSEQSIRTLGAALKSGSQDAIGSGLADRAGLLDEVWFDLAASLAPKSLPTSMASAAMTSLQEGIMSQPNAAAEVQQTTAAPPDLEKLKADAIAEGYTQAADISDLCAIAGKPELAADFISKRTKIADVRTALLAARATDPANEIASGTMPTTGANVGTTPETNSLIAACEKLAAPMRKGGR